MLAHCRLVSRPQLTLDIVNSCHNGSSGRGVSSGIANSIIGWAYLVQVGVAGAPAQPECWPYRGALCRGSVLLHPSPTHACNDNHIVAYCDTHPCCMQPRMHVSISCCCQIACHSITHSLTHPPKHTLTRSLTRSLTARSHLFIYSLILSIQSFLVFASSRQKADHCIS